MIGQNWRVGGAKVGGVGGGGGGGGRGFGGFKFLAGKIDNGFIAHMQLLLKMSAPLTSLTNKFRLLLLESFDFIIVRFLFTRLFGLIFSRSLQVITGDHSLLY